MLCTGVQGYLNRPDATKDAITHDKWFKTGDIAIRDKKGYYYIVDRRKELIKYKVHTTHSCVFMHSDYFP